MNFTLNDIPSRTTQPRTTGLTIISDKGLSIAETESVLSISAPYIDMAKLAFGTAMVTPFLKEKIQLYQSYNIPVFFGGLLFEAFVIRNQFNDYMKLIEDYNISLIEVSDGAIKISHEQKCDFIRQFCKIGTVISEIGSEDKDKVHITPPYKWIQLMQAELDAGSSYVIAEAKETGTVGLYRNSGEVREGLVEEILTKIPAEKIIWEAPGKDQQLFFIKLLGCNANLGNIAPSEVIPLETMRIGLRSDSFELFLDKDLFNY
ncbi:phosphosulfolactate synthase [Chitinophagaceae bacterium LB-8]|uniref:Phosphosulfolactate synthase n=1 Tax=Paraflavisolibacter caeni TaxID=2982496 RepID=A0A9X2XZK8_9BACT|nr:phosphosulfolactate synthase [Paraflavisolibacter caeni]MCU7552165.1 phosphosulfolactate synthase [Paraflavisolibacter caeni]